MRVMPMTLPSVVGVTIAKCVIVIEVGPSEEVGMWFGFFMNFHLL